MVGVVSYVLGPGRTPMNPLEQVDLLGRPLGTRVDVADEAGDLVLLDRDGNLTDAAIVIGCDYTESLFERSDDPARTWLPAWACQRDAQDCTATRRFLIDHPAGMSES
jgi:hypothetical protein